MEISEGYSLTTQSDSCRGKCSSFSWRWILCVAVVVTVSMVVLGILVTMFGPGSTDLKYHDRKDCTGMIALLHRAIQFFCFPYRYGSYSQP